jgi:hypothetical protein
MDLDHSLSIFSKGEFAIAHIYKILSHISNFFNDKSNHNKIYDNCFLKIE